MKHLRRLLSMSLLFLVAACGNSEAIDHNDHDISFAKEMIPHHAQAVTMSKLASTRASSSEVKQLATQIERAQQPEIDTMNNWLSAWGEPGVDPAAPSEHAGHGDVAGMLSANELTALEGASGAAFDQLFLEGMIKHHQGAIDMAKSEQENGEYPAAKTLAGSIVTSQQAEIESMKALLR